MDLWEDEEMPASSSHSFGNCGCHNLLEGLPAQHHYRRSRTNKAPRKRTFIMHMTKYAKDLMDCMAAQERVTMSGAGGGGGSTASFHMADPTPRLQDCVSMSPDECDAPRARMATLLLPLAMSGVLATYGICAVLTAALTPIAPTAAAPPPPPSSQAGPPLESSSASWKLSDMTCELPLETVVPPSASSTRKRASPFEAAFLEAHSSAGLDDVLVAVVDANNDNGGMDEDTAVVALDLNSSRYSVHNNNGVDNRPPAGFGSHSAACDGSDAHVPGTLGGLAVGLSVAALSLSCTPDSSALMPSRFGTVTMSDLPDGAPLTFGDGAAAAAAASHEASVSGEWDLVSKGHLEAPDLLKGVFSSKRSSAHHTLASAFAVPAASSHLQQQQQQSKAASGGGVGPPSAAAGLTKALQKAAAAKVAAATSALLQHARPLRRQVLNDHHPHQALRPGAAPPPDELIAPLQRADSMPIGGTVAPLSDCPVNTRRTPFTLPVIRTLPSLRQLTGGVSGMLQHGGTSGSSSSAALEAFGSIAAATADVIMMPTPFGTSPTCHRSVLGSSSVMGSSPPAVGFLRGSFGGKPMSMCGSKPTSFSPSAFQSTLMGTANGNAHDRGLLLGLQPATAAAAGLTGVIPPAVAAAAAAAAAAGGGSGLVANTGRAAVHHTSEVITCRKLISAGAYGDVYRARWGSRTVAAKLLKVPKPGDELSVADVLASFRVEAAIQGRLDHPHITRLLHVQLHEGPPTIVLQYAPWGTLSEYLHGEAPRPWAQLEDLVLSRLSRRVDCETPELLLLPPADAPGSFPPPAAATVRMQGGRATVVPPVLPNTVRRRVVLLGLMRDVACALAHLAGALPHGSVVTHRDVKLENVLINAEGMAQLSDFGVAQMLLRAAAAAAHEMDDPDPRRPSHPFGAEAGASPASFGGGGLAAARRTVSDPLALNVPTDTLVCVEGLHGTAQYAAPEDVWRPAGAGLYGLPVTPAADVFSLGVCLWECLAGQRPWHGVEAAAVIYNVGHLGMRLPVGEDWCPRLSAVVQACWHTDPTLRPRAADVVEVLDLEIATLWALLV